MLKRFLRRPVVVSSAAELPELVDASPSDLPAPGGAELLRCLVATDAHEKWMKVFFTLTTALKGDSIATAASAHITAPERVEAARVRRTDWWKSTGVVRNKLHLV